MAAKKRSKRGVSLAEARKLVLSFEGVEPGTSYGYPSFLLDGKFFARFRDDDTVLVIRLDSIDDRDVLMQIDPKTFFFTDHYRNYPAVLIRLAEAQPPMFRDVLERSYAVVAAMRKPRKRKR